jgi:hypothetical protein
MLLYGDELVLSARFSKGEWSRKYKERWNNRVMGLVWIGKDI